jgi:hypothetical protein
MEALRFLSPFQRHRLALGLSLISVHSVQLCATLCTNNIHSSCAVLSLNPSSLSVGKGTVRYFWKVTETPVDKPQSLEWRGCKLSKGGITFRIPDRVKWFSRLALSTEGPFPWRLSDRDVHRTIDLDLGVRLRKRGATTPFHLRLYSVVLN